MIMQALETPTRDQQRETDKKRWDIFGPAGRFCCRGQRRRRGGMICRSLVCREGVSMVSELIVMIITWLPIYQKPLPAIASLA